MSDRKQIGNTSNPPMTRVDRHGFRNKPLGKVEQRPGSKPVFTAHEITERYDDHRDAAKQARLFAESVGLENLASNRSVREQARDAVLAGLKDVHNVQEFLRNKWLILYRLYRGETLNEFNFGRLQLHSPEPFKIIETMHPRIMSTVFGTEKWFKLYGQEFEHDGNAIAQEALCRQQMRDGDFMEKQTRFIRDGLIYGTAAQKLWWKQDIKHMRYRRPRRVPDPDQPGTYKVKLEDVKREELVYDGNFTQNVSIFDLFGPPNASSAEEAEWLADRSYWPDYKVKQMGEMGHWKNLGELEDSIGSDDPTFGDEFKERKSYAYGVFDPREASNAPHVAHFTVYDWWGHLEIPDENGRVTSQLCNVTMVDPESRAVVVRVTAMPFWHQKKPYQIWRPINLEDELYGIGAIEMVARLSREKDVKRQIGMAATQLEANPAFLVSDQANIHDGQLIMEPGLCIRVPDVQNAIAPIHVPKVSDSAFKAEALLTSDIRETAGTTSPSMGAADPGGGSKTATQHTAELDMVSLRISTFINNYEQQVIMPMLHQMTWNNQQFQSYTRTVNDIGAVGINFKDRYQVSPEDLIGRFICKPLASFRLLKKQTMVQQLVNLLDRGPVINQMYGPDAVNMPKLLAYVLEQGFDVRNADEFIKIPEDEVNLLTPIEEHEFWYHGKVPPRRPDDNDLRHVMGHMEELGSERFDEFSKRNPQVASQVRAHIAEHVRKVALTKDRQEKRMMEFAQMAAEAGIQVPPGIDGVGMQGANIPGAASPGQDPGSPQIRRNENERGESIGGQNGAPGGPERAEAGRGAPNGGAQ